MIKLYLHLHNANSHFKKQLFTAGLLLFLLTNSIYVNAQCTTAPIVTPNPAAMCLTDAPIKLKAAHNLTGTVQFCSGPVNIAVPDNNPAGAVNSISVNSIPAGAIVSGMYVTINMPHTRIGDMVFALKAPNGNVLNLDYFLTGTNGSGSTTGFTNTIISSTGTAALSSGTDPYTGTFRPDAAGTASNPAPGPTGFGTYVAGFASLYTVPNGSWTLGFYDGVTNQVGTLSSWCISINYTLNPIGNSTAAIWSPISGLFSNAVATIPYTGTAVDSVWVKPAAPGVYTYQVTTQSSNIAGFTNTAAITIPDVGNANPYPSSVAVSGLPIGATVKSVVLHGLSHTYSEDIDILLQSPTGQNVTLMSDVGGGTLANGTYTFADAGSSMSFGTINPAGTYHPTNDAGFDTWMAPGPGSVTQAAPALSLFTSFVNHNGTWKLFVMDDNAADQGIISGGFTINFDLGTTACTSPPTLVVVTVNTQVGIVAQPVNKFICTDNVASFTVGATGNGLTYQWQVSNNGGASFTNIVNGGVYSGATTATLTITTPPVSMSGYRYKVVVSGAAPCNAMVSASAILTVNPLPTILISASPYYKLLPGLTTTLSSVVTPNPANVYNWLLDGNIIPGATADTIFVDFSGIGLYQLRVIDVNGCTNFSDTVRIKDSALGRMFVYPNPSSGSFQVRLYNTPGTVSPRTLTVYDNMGQKVITKPYTQTSSYEKIIIDAKRSGKGLYWIEVVDADGKRIAMSRVLIQ